MRRRVFEGLWRLQKTNSFAMASFSSAEKTTSFGYRRVDAEEKQGLVGDVFRSVADRYDLMNDVMSFGVHRLWKHYYVSQIPLSHGMEHLDVAGGTGDIAFRLLDRAAAENTPTRVVVLDLSQDMIRNGKSRMAKRGEPEAGTKLEWVVGDAEALPFPDASFHSYSIAFGIRNTTHMDAVLREAFRVLRPGGYFSCLEFSFIQNPVLRRLYDLYSFSVIPRVGQWIVGDEAAYQYLVESIRQFPKQEAFAELIREAGFRDVVYENLAAGGVSIHSGRKLD